jgi:alpha-beta hydrolase superfamily lysophospholipase
MVELARKDALMAFLAPFIHQAADEFPTALVALRDQLAVDDEPMGVLGGSLGGAVALEVLTTLRTPIKAVALVNPAVRIRSVVGLVGALMADSGQAYPWTAESRKTADELDFVARAADVTAQPPLLLVSGELDDPTLRTDAAALVDALRERYAHPDEVELRTVPDLPHPLAAEPGLEPAPQLPAAKVVDEILTQWFLRQLTAK